VRCQRRQANPGAAATVEIRMISVHLKRVEGPTLDNGRGTQTAGVAPSRLHHL
jgi:hypothetical protein